MPENPPQATAGSHPHTPTAGFAPLAPVGDTPILSLVPPITQADGVRHPDPRDTQRIAQTPLPTNAQVPVAPVRRRVPVTPLIQLPSGGTLEPVLQVAPVIPGHSLAPQPLQTGPAAYGVQPTTFPFWSAPAFQTMPATHVAVPPPLPVQTYVAFVTLLPQPPQWQLPPQYIQQQPQYHPQPLQQQFQPQQFQQPHFQQPQFQQPQFQQPVWPAPLPPQQPRA